MEEYSRRAEDKGQISLRELVIRIDERVATLTDNFKAREVKCPLDMGKFDDRIKSLETDRATIKGGAWVGAGIISAIIGLLFKWLK